MALLLKTTTVADEASHNIQRNNTTGVYDAITNPGGYGDDQIPLVTRGIDDISDGDIYVFPLSGSISANGGLLPETSELLYTAYLDQGAAQLFATTPEVLNLGTLIGNDYVDGIYFISYIERFVGIGTVSSVGSTNILTVPDYLEFVNAKYVYLDLVGDGSFTIYEIVSVNTDNTITINVSITLPGPTNFIVGYETINYFANVFDINKCLHSNIAKTACSDCGCNDAKKEKHFAAVMQFFGIQTNMDRGNYTCSKELIEAITIYCSKNGCGC